MATATTIVAAAALCLLSTEATGQTQSSADFVPVTDRMLQAPAPDDWLMWRRTLDSWGYSPLDQVTRENVAELRMVWSRALAPGRGEGTPLAYDGVLYIPQASDVIEAIDAVTGDLRWAHRRDLPDDVYDYVGGNARSNRNIASPAPKFMLGDVDNKHLYHNSTLALDVDSGEIRWYYQHLNDHWDLDHPFERMLLDTAVTPNSDAVRWINPRLRPGEVRKVMTGIPGKTGVVYTLDRETGEFLWATPTIAQNVISNIDGATGVVTENSEVVFSAEGQEILACPNMHGGKDWEAGAYSPLTNTMYFPLRNMCQRLLATTAADASHRIYALAVRHQLAPGTEQLGAGRGCFSRRTARCI